MKWFSILYLGVVPALGAVLHSQVLLVLSGVNLVASALAFLRYGMDKFAAQEGRFRVSESELHSWEMLGGWPGAALAQSHFRHKTKKQPFRQTFFVMVALNIAITMAAATVGIGPS